LLNDQSNTVGRTHLGFVYCIETPTTGMNYRPDAKAKRGEWMSPASLWDTQRVHEHWSKMLITESRIIPIPNTTWRARA
jgi:predicted NUDIX family phosphoesterase